MTVTCGVVASLWAVISPGVVTVLPGGTSPWVVTSVHGDCPAGGDRPCGAVMSPVVVTVSLPVGPSPSRHHLCMVTVLQVVAPRVVMSPVRGDCHWVVVSTVVVTSPMYAATVLQVVASVVPCTCAWWPSL